MLWQTEIGGLFLLSGLLFLTLPLAGACSEEKMLSQDGSGTTGGMASTGSGGTAGPTGGMAGTGGMASIGGGGGSTVCVPGTTVSCYEGPPNTEGIGTCAGGSSECLPDGYGYGPCVGQTLPEPTDDCNDTLDQDCDGIPAYCFAPFTVHVVATQAEGENVDVQYAGLSVTPGGNARVGYHYYYYDGLWRFNELRVATYTGNGFTTQTIVSSNWLATVVRFLSMTLGPQGEPCVAGIDGWDNSLYVVCAPSWTKQDYGTGVAATRIAAGPNNQLAVAFRNSSSLLGVAEPMQTLVQPAVQPLDHLSAVFDAQGDLHLAYATTDAILHSVRVNGTWQTETAAMVSSNQALPLALTLDGAGRAVIAYRDPSTAEVALLVQQANNTYQKTVLDSGANLGHGIWALTDPYGRLHVSYGDVTNRAVKIAVLEQGQWMKTSVSLNGAGPIISPNSFQMALDANGKHHIALNVSAPYTEVWYLREQ